MSIFKVKNKNGTISYGYYFRDRVTKQRYRKIVPLARTKWDAEQAEIKAKQEILDKRHGLEEKGKDLLSTFSRRSLSALVESKQKILAR